MTVGRIPSVEGGIQPTLLTAKGDLISATAASTVARLPVGSDTQILVADSSTSTGLKWATPAAASSGMTFISRTSFSNVASQAIDSVFSSSYYSYIAIIETIGAATDTDNLLLQMRYGSTTQAADYYGGGLTTNRINTTITNTPFDNVAQLTIGLESGQAGQPAAMQINFNQVGNTSEPASIYGFGLIAASGYGLTSFAAKATTSRTYTGFLLKSSSSNISGVVSVYGLAKA